MQTVQTVYKQFIAHCYLSSISDSIFAAWKVNIVTATIASVDMATGSQDTMHDVEEISYNTLMSPIDGRKYMFTHISVFLCI